MIFIGVADPAHELQGKRYLSTSHKGVWRTESMDSLILNHDTTRRGLASRPDRPSGHLKEMKNFLP
jgi:hypothetical protein